MSRQVVAAWPLVESILEAFAQATKLPLFVYLDDAKVFMSSLDHMPEFCHAMLSNDDTRYQCVADGARRATASVADVEPHTQYCHAGLLNQRRQFAVTNVGKFTILFGSRHPRDSRSLELFNGLLGRQDTLTTQALRSTWLKADQAGLPAIREPEASLMDAIAGILQRLLGAMVEARSLGLHMAHEVSHSLLALGLTTREILEFDPNDATAHDAAAIMDLHRIVYDECRLGLYVTRNFLASLSGDRYRELVPQRFVTVDLGSLVDDMIELHRGAATARGLAYDVSGLSVLPAIKGDSLELRRLLHNVLSNAVKYSYHSTATTQRVVRIRARPYDPGFKQPRFVLSVENYGLGLTEGELNRVFDAGFRGEQARREVPLGSGIGLSEARKIMELHGGEIRCRSEIVHSSGDGASTYLTRIDLIFPYSAERGSRT